MSLVQLECKVPQIKRYMEQCCVSVDGLHLANLVGCRDALLTGNPDADLENCRCR